MTTGNGLAKTSLAMAWAWGIFFSFNALGSCILAAFVNATWEDMSTAKRVLMFIAIFVNWTSMMMAFLSKTMARLDAGKNPVPDPVLVAIDGKQP